MRPVASELRSRENDFILTDDGVVRRRELLVQRGLSETMETAEAGWRSESGQKRLSRRSFLAKSGMALTYLAAFPLWDRLAGSAFAQDSVWSAPGMEPEITPVGSFYNISKNLFDPTVDVRGWSLTVEGLVERPITLDYERLTRGDGPTFQQYVALTCISNEVGGDLAGNAMWRGIRLRDLLQSAGVKDGAVDLVMEAHDDYTDSIPIGKAMHPDTMLVWEMNGAPLTHKHGYPVRLIVPGIYGMKSVKWLRRLEVVDYDYLGFWARRGWDDVAHIKTWSRLDAPRATRVARGAEVVVGGVAFAGVRGVDNVEVSFDGGATWSITELKEPLGPYAWRLWAKRWTPGGPGRHVVQVRATDGNGETQSDVRVPTLPDGAEGYHSRILRV